jgi:hypothetical protein
MEAITQLVVDSLARHGFDRPVDPRRLQWSRWSRCDTPHSLLVVPSKPGIFALAEEVVDLGVSTDHVGTAAPGCPAEQSSAAASSASNLEGSSAAGADRFLGGAALQRCDSLAEKKAVLAAEPRRMLAVLQFSEDDDMAFTLDRMFTRINPMRERLASGKCFLRFVVVEDQAQRRSICAALNQWMTTSAEKATGLADFQSSLELNVARTCPEMASNGPSPASADSVTNRVGTDAFVRPASEASAPEERVRI